MLNGLTVGDVGYYAYADFDGAGLFKIEITEVHDDYALAKSLDGTFPSLWIDDDTSKHYFASRNSAVKWLASEGFSEGSFTEGR